MNECLSICIITFILQLISIDVQCFSLKSITHWAFAIKEETAYHEFPFNHGGTLTISHKNSGSIKIKSWTRPMLVIKSNTRFKEKEEKPMLSFSIKDHIGTIESHSTATSKALIDLECMVPEKTNVTITSDGSVKVKSIDGTLNICAMNSVDIRHSSQSIQVKTDSDCSVRMHTVPISSTVKIISHGQLFLAVPPDTHAQVTAKTDHGYILCDHFFTFKPFSAYLTKAGWENVRKNINGILGNGGPSITLTSINGPIIIGNSRE